MSNFTPLADYTVEFEGDTVTMQLRRLKREDQQKLVPFMGEVGDDGKAKMTFKDQMEMSNAMQDLLPGHVKNFKGLRDANSANITLEVAIDEVYFQDLVGKILMELMHISNVGIKEEKKSEAQPDESSKE